MTCALKNQECSQVYATGTLLEVLIGLTDIEHVYLRYAVMLNAVILTAVSGMSVYLGNHGLLIDKQAMPDSPLHTDPARPAP